MRLLRWTAYAIAAVVGVAAVAATAVYGLSARDMGRTWTIPPSPVVAATDSAEIARGRHIVSAIAKCQDCHGDDFGGQMLMNDPVFASIPAPNITPAGIPGYTDADFERAIRHAVARDGKPLVFMPAEAYWAMSDDDLAAVIGYLRTVPPVERSHPRPKVGPIARMLHLRGAFPLLPAQMVDHENRPAKPAEAVTEEYGGYLAMIGGCRGCHGPQLRGDGDPAAPDISPAGVTASWSEADFFKALRQGTRPDGTTINGDIMPWARSGLMTDDEMRAVWLYIRSLPGAPAAS